VIRDRQRLGKAADARAKERSSEEPNLGAPEI